MSMLTMNENEIQISAGYLKTDNATISVRDAVCGLCDNKIISTVEKDYHKFIVFDVRGIPEDAIKVKTSFVNKTKRMYIEIVGNHHDEYLEYKSEIHEKIFVDTDIYEKYDFEINNGLLILILSEKVNKKPDFKRVGV